ncbi:MAG: 16S rRNA (guanine(966)-N(2))-methyltransferase RsmD [Parasphingopyxis sp.]
MRIIAGEWRGRKLEAPPGDATRPTADRVRETLFSMLASRLGSFEGLRVADLFAGSGALGLEALSRGAAHCTFVERDRDALAALKANIARLGARSEVQPRDAAALGPAPSPFDLLLLDPPYAKGLGEQALREALERGWIGPASWISLETARGEDIAVEGLAAETVRGIGKTQITLLRPI